MLKSTFEELRRSEGLTQERLAEQAGISVEAVRKIENGATKFPQASTVKALAQALKTSEHSVRTAIKLTQHELSTQIQRNEAFHTLASQNARCDVEIFHTLFVDEQRQTLTEAQKRYILLE